MDNHSSQLPPGELAQWNLCEAMGVSCREQHGPFHFENHSGVVQRMVKGGGGAE